MKRLLLLSSLIFGLALSGCGNGNNNGDDNGKKPDKENAQKAKLGETCTKEKACETGLACALLSGQTDKGKCETACDNGTCTGTDQECRTDVAGLEGKTVKVCREKSTVTPPAPQKKELGQPCTEPTECKENLVCVADAGKTDKGKCQTACPQNTCTDGTLTCQNVDGLNNSKVDACLTPPPVERKEGEECKVGEKCKDGTHCIAKVGRPDVGVCTEAVDCTTDDTKCTKPNEVCQPERVLDGAPALRLCGEAWCTDSSSCKSDEFCMVSATDQSRGHCTKMCDDKSAPCPNGETCQGVGTYTTESSFQPQTCLPNEVAQKIALGHPGCDTKPCRDEGAICVNAGVDHICTMPCTIPGYNIECKSRATNDNRWCRPFDGKLGCGPGFGLNGTKGENETCGGIDLCDHSKNLFCKLNSKEGNEGTCIKVMNPWCLKDDDCTNAGDKCQVVIEEDFHYGSPYYLKGCLP